MKKLISLLLIVCLLSGCQLASEEKNESQIQDKLVGVFVTFEDLGLPFDIEGYLNDNVGSLSDGEEIVVGEGEAMAYEGKLYAEVGERGWSFPGYDGIIMGQMLGEDHWISFSTEGFCDMKTHFTETETLDGIEEEGTIYAPKDTKDFIFYSNPVYMTPDGKYYAVQGNAFSSGNAGVHGMSQHVSCEIKETTNGVENTYSAKFTTRIEGIVLADQVVLVQMSADHAELSRAEYVPGQMPESITPADGTAYIIVEEIAGEEVTRTLYQPEDENFQVFYQGDAVYCLPQFTAILWENK